MTPEPNPQGWGALNIALNGLVKGGVIRSYSTGKTPTSPVEVVVDGGADQVEVVGAVRAALGPAFADVQVRTRIAD